MRNAVHGNRRGQDPRGWCRHRRRPVRDRDPDAPRRRPARDAPARAEIYQVLEGEFTFYTATDDGVRRVTTAAGTVMPLAGGVPHTIRNESDSDAVAFVVHAPGAPME